MSSLDKEREDSHDHATRYQLSTESKCQSINAVGTIVPTKKKRNEKTKPKPNPKEPKLKTQTKASPRSTTKKAPQQQQQNQTRKSNRSNNEETDNQQHQLAAAVKASLETDAAQRSLNADLAANELRRGLQTSEAEAHNQAEITAERDRSVSAAVMNAGLIKNVHSF